MATWLVAAIAVGIAVLGCVALLVRRHGALVADRVRSWRFVWSRPLRLEINSQYGRFPRDAFEGDYTVQNLFRLGDDTRNAKLHPAELLATGEHVIITGQAGVGKSTTLEMLRSFAEKEFWRGTLTRFGLTLTRASHPHLALLSARDLVGEKTIEACLRTASHGRSARGPAPEGKWLVLVDAVDEVLKSDERRQVWDVLLTAMSARGQYRFVITSRSLDATHRRDLESNSVAHYRLNPFTDSQLFEFAIGHQRREKARGGLEGYSVVHQAARFLDHFRSNGLIDVIGLPLLAELAADAYFDHSDRDLRLCRVDLYELSIERQLAEFEDVLEARVSRESFRSKLLDVGGLLNRLHERYPVAAKIGRAEVVRAFMTDVAARHLDDSKRETSRGLVHIVAAVMDMRAWDHDRMNRMAKAILVSAGLIDEQYSRGRLSHHTFAEYLAAPDTAETISEAPDVWIPALNDPSTQLRMIFTFHHLTPERQENVIKELTATSKGVRCAAILVAEKLCSPAMTRHVMHELLQATTKAPRLDA